MSRIHPSYCEHGKCFDPGDSSFGLEVEDCQECRPEPSTDDLQAAFDLGQTYQYYANHEFYSYNKKADGILEQFRALRNKLEGE